MTSGNSLGPLSKQEKPAVHLTLLLCPTWGLFLESPDNFLGLESYFMCAMFALKTQILLVLKAEQ